MGTSAELDYWEQIFASRGWGSYPPEELVRFMARSFGVTPDKSAISVLEVGCGPGPNIWYLVREGYTVAGIDGSATAIEQAKQRLASEGLSSQTSRVDLRVGNFVALPWPENTFDAVIDIEALYANSMDDIRTVLGEIRRTLKAGGLFFGKMFGDATTGSDSGTDIEPGTRLHPTSGPCAGNAIAHFFSKAELEALFAGFDNVSIDFCERTDHNGALRICEWLVTARK